MVVCGHTHMQFDRMVGGLRVVNAGSVGMPFGTTGADWLLLGPGIELRKTQYDLNAAAERLSPNSIRWSRRWPSLHPQPAVGAGALRRVGVGGGVMRSVRLQPDLSSDGPASPGEGSEGSASAVGSDGFSPRFSGNRNPRNPRNLRNPWNLLAPGLELVIAELTTSLGERLAVVDRRADLLLDGVDLLGGRRAPRLRARAG